MVQALDPPCHRLGQRRTGGARLSRPLRLSHRSHQRAHRRPRRRNGHHPIQGPQDRPRANRPLQRDEFMRRFLQHVLPRGFHKVRYFGLWHPRQRHNAARVRRMLQLQAPPKLDPAVGFRCSAALATADAEATPSIEPLVCPHCQGAADLHPHALAAAGHCSTMTRSTHPRRKRFALVTACAGTPQRPLVSGAIRRTSFGDGSVAARPETAAPSIDGSAQSQNTRRPAGNISASTPCAPVKSP